MVSYKELGLVNTREMFAKAIKGGYAIPAFNFNNMEQMQAIVQACVETSSPVIMQVSSGARKYANPTILRYMAQGAVEYAKELGKNIPIVLHLDHGDTFELCKDCVDMGFSSVMIDGSHLPYDENVALTKKVVEYAHKHDVTVEGELGVLAGVEDEVSAEHHTYTRPEDVEDFVKKTGVDSLAISIGTSHGANKFKPEQCTRNADGVLVPPELRFDILEEIEKRIPGFPIVLHGSSSVPQEYVKMINDHGGRMPNAIGVAPCRQERRLQDQHRLGQPSGHDGRRASGADRQTRRVRSPQIPGAGPRGDEEALHAQMRESSRIGRQGVADSCGLRYRTGQFVRSGFFFPEMWVAVRILFFFAYNQYSMVMKKYELKNNKALGRYEFDLDGATAVVDYEECGPGCIAVTHTGVPDRFCGQGIASQLTVAVLEDLKRQGLKVVPLCRFMARYILRHPEWKQMVADK